MMPRGRGLTAAEARRLGALSGKDRRAEERRRAVRVELEQELRRLAADGVGPGAMDRTGVLPFSRARIWQILAGDGGDA